MASLTTHTPPATRPHPTPSPKTLKIKKYRQQFMRKAVFRLHPTSSFELMTECEPYSVEVHQPSWGMAQYFDFSDII
jgi:hypothetical protein